jgi:hypothetical protein
MAMRRFELDDLVNRPGTYFNPRTEMVLVVDDSTHLDAEVFDEDEAEETDWILVSEEVPIDEHARDELLEAFATRHTPAAEGLGAEEDDEDFDDERFEDSGFDVQDPDEE